MSSLTNNLPNHPQKDEMQVLLDMLDQRQRLHMPTQEILSRIKTLSERRKPPVAGDLLLSRYQLIQKLEGDNATTMWHGFDTKQERHVSLCFSESNISGKAAQTAWSQLKDVHHKNLAGVLEIHPNHQPPFYVQEYARDAFSKIRAQGLNPTDTLKWIVQVGEALDQVHKAGFLYLNVQPNAIRFKEDGAPMLCRHDMAILKGSKRPPVNSVFSSPEAQAGNQALGPESDVYSLAATAIFAFSKKESVFKDPLQQLDGLPIPEKAKKVLYVAINEAPTERYPQISDFCLALQEGFRDPGAEESGPSFALKIRQEIQRWQGSLPWSGALLDRLAADGFFLTEIQWNPEAGRCLIQARVPESLKEEYGTAPEILFLVVGGPVTGRDIRAAKDALLLREFELDRDLLAVVDGKPDLESRIKGIVPRWGQRIPLPLIDGSFPSVFQQFRLHSFSYDIFEERDPVRGRQVFGRTETISELIRHIKRGDAVGVYGLRKMGKTTTVVAALDKLDPPGNRNKAILPVVHLDLGSVPERNLNGLCSALNRKLVQTLTKWLPEYERSTSQSPMEELGRHLTQATENIDAPLCIALDEFDLVFEDEAGNPGVREIERFFSLLRGVSQQTGLLALVLIGRDPTFLNRPTMSGRANPMLGWCRDFWLGPMPREEADQLLTGLGSRVRLNIGPATLDAAYNQTGGHPLLHRQFGSALLEQARTELEQLSRVDTDPLLEKGLSTFLERQMVVTVCTEVDHLFQRRYKGAWDLLRKLVENPLVTKNPEDWENYQQLKHFGLVIEQGDRLFIPMAIRRYFQKTAAA